MTGPADRWIRRTTIGCVGLLALIAGTVSLPAHAPAGRTARAAGVGDAWTTCLSRHACSPDTQTNLYARAVTIAAPWDELTAIGTLALAAVTAAAVIVTLVITYQDRRRADRRISEERDHDRHLAQDQQASDVYVTRTVIRPQATTSKQSAIATIVNGGDYTITQLVARFSIAGHLSDPKRVAYVPAAEVSALVGNTDTRGYTEVLTPGTGLRVASALVEAADAEEAIPVVRWTDRWEQRWEYREGIARRIKPDEQWDL
jgi:hypothetical protein